MGGEDGGGVLETEASAEMRMLAQAELAWGPQKAMGVEPPLEDISCDLVWRGGVQPGRLRLTRSSLRFHRDAPPADGGGGEGCLPPPLAGGGGSQLWPVAELKQMQRRRY